MSRKAVRTGVTEAAAGTSSCGPIRRNGRSSTSATENTSRQKTERRAVPPYAKAKTGRMSSWTYRWEPSPKTQKPERCFSNCSNPERNGFSAEGAGADLETTISNQPPTKPRGTHSPARRVRKAGSFWNSRSWPMSGWSDSRMQANPPCWPPSPLPSPRLPTMPSPPWSPIWVL